MLDLKNIHGQGDAFILVPMLAACLIAGAYPMVKLIGWWIDGGIDSGLAVLALFMYLVLILGATMLPPAMGVLIILLIASSAIVLPYVGKLAEEHDSKRIEQENYDRYAAALERNPRDAAARMALAECLYKRGELDLAIEHMSWTLKEFPALSFRIKPQLDSWKREKERGPLPDFIICHLCSAENLPGADHCEKCGAAFGTRDSLRERILAEGGPKVVIRGWIVVAATLILSFFALLVLPSIIAGPLIIAMLIAAAWLFLRWVGGDMGTVGE